MTDMIGKMDAACELLQNTPVSLGAGNKDQYAILLTTRGYLKKMSGNRTGGLADIALDNSWTLIVRKQAALVNALRADLKWRIGGKVYTIQTWEDVNEDHFYYKFTLSSVNA